MRRLAAQQLMRAVLMLQEGRLGTARGLAVLAHRIAVGLHPVVTQATNLRHALLPPASLAVQAMQNGTQQQQQRRGVFIQTQPTPNPLSLMFVPGKPVVEGGGTLSFSNAREAMASPLAKRLFQIDGVTQVFFGSDFVTITKSEDYSWAVLKPDVFAAIMDHYSSGEPLLYDQEHEGAAEHLITEDDDEVVAMIKELLETRIRPAVQEDGGDIKFRSFDPDSGIVELKMMGACSGCPSSAITLKSGIENMLMHYIPEVKGVVEALPDEHEQEGLKAFNDLEKHLSA